MWKKDWLDGVGVLLLIVLGVCVLGSLVSGAFKPGTNHVNSALSGKK